MLFFYGSGGTVSLWKFRTFGYVAGLPPRIVLLPLVPHLRICGQSGSIFLDISDPKLYHNVSDKVIDKVSHFR